jgi:putative SbcD/Mre11-related phosphoesterase
MDSVEVLPGVSIFNDLCLYLENDGLLAMADLHVGYEAALEEEGVHLPRFQTATIQDAIFEILDKHEPEAVLINGDIKHEFSRNLGQEWSDVKSILSLLRERAKVILIRGNHDNYLKNIASRLDIEILDIGRIGGMTFVHGHSHCSERPLVMAHEHPSVRIVDRVGAAVKLPCFIHFRNDDVIVMPAFSPLAVGTNIVGVKSSEFLSPILRKCDVTGTSVYGCSEIGILNFGSIPFLGEIKV